MFHPSISIALLVLGYPATSGVCNERAFKGIYRPIKVLYWICIVILEFSIEFYCLLVCSLFTSCRVCLHMLYSVIGSLVQATSTLHISILRHSSKLHRSKVCCQLITGCFSSNNHNVVSLLHHTKLLSILNRPGRTLNSGNVCQ